MAFELTRQEHTAVAGEGQTTPSQALLEDNFPNPFNGDTAIPFSLTRDQTVELSLYTSTGQKIKTLVNRAFGAGRHLVTWDGRGSGGQRLASGVYFYRLKTASGIAAGKLVLSR